MLDRQAPGPDFTFRVPFQIQLARQPHKELAEIRSNEIVFMKPVSAEDQLAVPIHGFGDNASDAEIVIENRKVGAGVRITGDRPLVRNLLWSIRNVLAIEPYIAIEIQPGAEFTWKNMFEYYTLPNGR